MPEDSQFQLGYRPSIEGIRALSILAVMLVHTDIPHHGGGFLSVDASFVVSGFLITSSLLLEHRILGKISLKRFYIRRGLRILPVLFTMLLIWTVTSILFHWYSPLATVKISAFAGTYLANWAIGLNWAILDAVSQTWSLAIEEQFYLCWPLLLVFMLNRGLRLRSVGWLIALGIAASAVLRAVLWGTGGSFDRIIFGTDTRGAGGLLLGCLLGVIACEGGLARLRKLSRQIRVLAWLGAATVVGSIIWLADKTGRYVGDFTFYFGLTTTTAGVFFVMLHILTAPRNLFARFLETRALVWIGNMSYSLFVWHLLVYNILLEILRPDHFTVGFAALEVLTATAVAVVSFFVIERPFLRLRKRFRRQGVLTDAGTR